MAATEAEKAGQDTDSPGFNDAGSKTSETAKKTAPGVVLGKDGKP